MEKVAAEVFLIVVMSSGAFLLLFSIITLSFAVVYGRTRVTDPPPERTFDDAERPRVTVQLPIRNEGVTSERIIRTAAALDYPTERLQIQVLDDSDDETSELVERMVALVRRERPGLDIAVNHRETREGFKAGALRNGTASATGEFLVIFDADFIIPPEFLQRTIHYFTDPRVGIVQARWAYTNRQHSVFTRFQATKLDAHQMFDQAARARIGWWTHFHGTAGILRRHALEHAGGWDCISEVEDIEISIRTYLKGWTTVYLDDFRIPSELPETVIGFLTQQMRWKRGWVRVLKHYGAAILASPVSLPQKLDLIGRLVNAFGSLVSIPFTLGALPAFIIAEPLGVWWPTILLYASLLVVAVCMRIAEVRYIEESTNKGTSRLVRWLRMLLPIGMILNMGMTPAMVQGTLEGLGGTRRWEVTPKSGSFARAAAVTPRISSYIFLTIATALASLALLAASLLLGHPFAGVFYLMMTSGCAWIAGTYLCEYVARRAAMLPARTTE